MRSVRILPMVAVLVCAVAATSALAAPAQGDGAIDIPFERFVLGNGLTLLVHEDHKAPIVAVNVWYHVGSKNEKSGKTGFAHLFEHLMFNGSENNDDDYFNVMERIGATTLNGTTNEDRTNYFQNVPTSALDVALWMESDRMGHLLGAVTQEKLDEQRGVVQNEKRQYENQPYAVAYELQTKATWPAAHPYSWTVIGSMEDLGAASLEDAHGWFKTYYGAANATLVLAGDIDPETALEKAKLYFGDIPAGPPVARHEAWIARRTGEQRQRVDDRVPQARLDMSWNVPGWGTEDTDLLELVASVLGTGKSSRLYRRLVYDDQIATSVSVSVDDREIASQFDIQAMAKPGGDLDAVEKAIREELHRFLEHGPTAEEVERARSRWLSEFVRGLETVGGFGGKSDVLAKGQVFMGDPGHYRTTLGRVRDASAGDLARVAREWLSDGAYLLEVHPYPELSAAEAGADRSKLPGEGEPPAVRFPKLQRTTLGNGLEVVLAERDAVPIVELTLMTRGGYASDVGTRPGTASLAMAMMDEGTKSRSAIEISDELARLGAELSAGASLDWAEVTISALKENLDATLELFADVALRPSFPENELERLRKQRLAQIQAEKRSPTGMALRVLPRVLYGEGSAYGNPFTGSGFESSVAEIGRDDLVAFHRDWFVPNHSVLVVVGDTSIDELRPKLERLFRDWKKGDVPKVAPPTTRREPSRAIYLIDRPGSVQSVILAGEVVPPRGEGNEVAIDAFNDVLGGSFTARINMNLREDKHWSYGAGSFLPDAVGPRPFIGFAPVQSDKTREAVVELDREFREIVGSNPATPDELAKVKDAQTKQLPGNWETIGSVAGSVAEIVQFGLDDDYFDTLPAHVRRLDLDTVRTAGAKLLHPGAIQWVIVGDRASIEPTLAELGWGEIRYLDPDGNPIEAP